MNFADRESWPFVSSLCILLFSAGSLSIQRAPLLSHGRYVSLKALCGNFGVKSCRKHKQITSIASMLFTFSSIPQKKPPRYLQDTTPLCRSHVDSSQVDHFYAGAHYFFTNLPMGTFVLQFWSSLAERLMLRLTSPRLEKTPKAGRDTARTSDQRNSWCLGIAAHVVRAQPHCSGLGPRDLNCQDCCCCLGCNCAYKHCATSRTKIPLLYPDTASSCPQAFIFM